MPARRTRDAHTTRKERRAHSTHPEAKDANDDEALPCPRRSPPRRVNRAWCRRRPLRVRGSAFDGRAGLTASTYSKMTRPSLARATLWTRRSTAPCPRQRTWRSIMDPLATHAVDTKHRSTRGAHAKQALYCFNFMFKLTVPTKRPTPPSMTYVRELFTKKTRLTHAASTSLLSTPHTPLS